MTIPSDLLNAIATPGGGQVSLVLGAGCSKEQPTNLPLAAACAEEAHRRLVEDGILGDGDCNDPKDLSALADLVKQRFDGNQIELVKRLPVREFKNATANEGHIIAAALMVEGAITNIVTLNYDLALTDALSSIGVESEVAVICGPEQHAQMGNSNVIYLHRSVDADFETWILTSEALDEEWKGAWEETVARFAISSVTVFAGMGSSCGVLRHSTAKLREAVPDARVFLANPGDPAKSDFAKEIELNQDDYIRLGWVGFMQKLGERFHSETVNMIGKKCIDLSWQEDWINKDDEKPLEDVDQIKAAVQSMGLLGFGRFRAATLLHHRQFPKIKDEHLVSVADLLLAVFRIQRVGNAMVEMQNDGHVVFHVDSKPPISVLLVDGSAQNYRWQSLERRLHEYSNLKHSINGKVAPKILAFGVSGRRLEDVSAPESIVHDSDSQDIVDADPGFTFWHVDDVRDDAGTIGSILS